MQQTERVEVDDERETMNTEQRLKAATYYSIKKMAHEVEEEMEVTVSPQVLATLNESLHRQVAKWTSDVENFAKHAKRTDINMSDVRLVARRNDSLLNHLDSMIKDMEAADSEVKKGKSVRGRQKKSKDAVAVVDVVVDDAGDD